MRKIDRKTAQEGFNQLINLIEKARGKNDVKETEVAAKAAIEFISKLGGTEIAQWLMNEGLSPLPETIFTKSPQPAEVGTNTYIHKSLAKFILEFQEVLDAAHINAGVLNNDLIQMSLDKGDDPDILINPNKKTKIRMPRVTKNAASMRIVEIIFYEVGRTGKKDTEILELLYPFDNAQSDAQEDAREARDRHWRKIKRLFKDRIPDFRNREKESAEQHAHANPKEFQELWFISTST